MLTLPASVKIYLASDVVDMRKSIDGLSALVQHVWSLDPYSGHLFVFAGRRGERVKILAWDHGGFVLYYKRLERGQFRLPKIPPGSRQVELDATALAMLLDGIDTASVRRPRRWQPPRYESVALADAKNSGLAEAGVGIIVSAP